MCHATLFFVRVYKRIYVLCLWCCCRCCSSSVFHVVSVLALFGVSGARCWISLRGVVMRDGYVCVEMENEKNTATSFDTSHKSYASISHMHTHNVYVTTWHAHVHLYRSATCN